MRIETVQRPLRELVRSFTTGTILLPQFQRDYVWKPKKIRNLLDSLLQEYPIGGFYLWRPHGAALDPKPKHLQGGRQIAGAEFWGYLIDGQQRLTSLEAAYALYSGEDRNGVELRCYLDLAATNVERRRDTKLFVSYGGHRAIARRVDDGDQTLIPVSRFFDKLDKAAEREQDRETEELLGADGWSKRRIQDALERLDGCGVAEGARAGQVEVGRTKLAQGLSRTAAGNPPAHLSNEGARLERDARPCTSPDLEVLLEYFLELGVVGELGPRRVVQTLEEDLSKRGFLRHRIGQF